MSVKSLNIGKKADFALATGSSLETIRQLFGGTPGEWDIEEASYNSVTFHVFKSQVDWGGALPSVRDSGGRRLVKYKFPYRDGQTTDDLGAEPETFSLDILLFGESYRSGLVQLMKELQKPEPGLLVHPVRGVITCKMQDYELTHSVESRFAVALKVTFVQHSFTLASYGKIAEKKTFKGIIASLLQVFNVINGAVNKVRALVNLVNSVRATILDAYESYLAAFQTTLVSVNQVFNKGTSADIPALVPVNQGGVLQPDGTLSSTSFPDAVNPDDPYRNVPVAQIQAAIAANSAVLASQENAFQILANVSTALASLVIQNQINSCRALADNLIKILEATPLNQGSLLSLGTDSDGSLEFYLEILDLKRSVILLQNAYETGLSQTQASVIRYKVPRLMSLREVAFANNLDPDRSLEIDLLNPELESVNFLPAGTDVLVPV